MQTLTQMVHTVRERHSKQNYNGAEKHGDEVAEDRPTIDRMYDNCSGWVNKDAQKAV